jgi:hypothetical protein
MEEVRRVMGPKVMVSIRQKAWGFIACGWHDSTRQTRESLLHERVPGVLVAGLSCLRHNNGVALGVHRHQAKPAGTRCLLGHGEVFGGHDFGQTRAGLSAIRHDSLLHLPVALVLGPRGRADKAIAARAVHQETHQTHPTGPDCGPDQMYPEAQAMQEGQTWGAVKKGDHGWLRVETLLVGPPCLQCGAGNVKRLSRLTLGQALGLSITILRKTCRTLGAMPMRVAIMVASLLVLDDGSHGDLLVPSSALVW